MTARTITVDPFDMVVFGATGDLAARKLMPALYQRDRAGQIPGEARVAGVSRRGMTGADYVGWVREQLEKYVPQSDREPAAMDRFLSRIGHVTLDATSDEGWSELKQWLGQAPDRIRAFYLAVTPDLAREVAVDLEANGETVTRIGEVIEGPRGRTVRGSAEAWSAREAWEARHLA